MEIIPFALKVLFKKRFFEIDPPKEKGQKVIKVQFSHFLLFVNEKNGTYVLTQPGINRQI